VVTDYLRKTHWSWRFRRVCGTVLPFTNTSEGVGVATQSICARCGKAAGLERVSDEQANVTVVRCAGCGTVAGVLDSSGLAISKVSQEMGAAGTSGKTIARPINPPDLR
jgi:hypothetical protein